MNSLQNISFNCINKNTVRFFSTQSIYVLVTKYSHSTELTYVIVKRQEEEYDSLKTRFDEFETFILQNIEDLLNGQEEYDVWGKSEQVFILTQNKDGFIQKMNQILLSDANHIAQQFAFILYEELATRKHTLKVTEAYFEEGDDEEKDIKFLLSGHESYKHDLGFFIEVETGGVFVEVKNKQMNVFVFDSKFELENLTDKLILICILLHIKKLHQVHDEDSQKIFSFISEATTLRRFGTKDCLVSLCQRVELCHNFVDYAFDNGKNTQSIDDFDYIEALLLWERLTN